VNGRIVEEDSPEGRLAAVAVMIRQQLRKIRREREWDYADLRDGFRSPLQLELCRARISEVEDLAKDPRLKSYALFRLRELRLEEQELERKVRKLAES
jgi:hypothetical protein